MNTFHGHVTEVAQEIRGSEAVADLAVDESTSLPLADLADFDETGGQVLVNGEVLDYTGTYGDDEEPEQGLTLTAPNPVAITAEDRVDVWNPATGDVVSEWVATVADDLDGSAIRAPLAHALIDMLGEGVEGLAGNSVTCEVDETGQWTVTEILGKTPTVDGSFIDPVTIPPYAPSEKPATSPTVTAYGLPDSFMLRAGDIDPTTVLQYQVSPDGGTTWYDTGGASIASQILQVKTYGPSNTPFALNTDYVFRTQADNSATGTPPAPSAASAAVRLDTSRVALIASELIAAELNADRALVGELSIGGPAFTLMPPGLHPDDAELNKGGLRIITTTGAVIHFPADGSKPVLRGLDTVEVDNLDATNLDVQGVSRITGSFTMGATIADPLIAPTVEADYETFTPDDTVTGVVGFCRNIDDDGWVYVTSAPPSLIKINDDGVMTASAAIGNHISSPCGVTRFDTDAPGGEGAGYLIADLVSPTEVYVWFASEGLTTSLDLFNIIDDLSGVQSATIGPDIDPTSGSYALAFATVSNTVMRRYDLFGVLLGQTTLVGLTGNLGGIYFGPGDFGANRWVLQQRTLDPLVYSNNVLQSGEAWPRAAGYPSAGLWWDGTHFWTISTGGRIRRYETAASAPAATYGFSYDWRDSDTHHTGPSPEKTFTRPKRARIKVTATVAPQVGAVGTHIADRVQIYAATPNGGTKYPQGSALAAGYVATTLTTVAQTGTVASANNWSGVSAAGYIDASVGGFKVDGNSNGTVGTGTFRDTVIAATHRGRAAHTSNTTVNTTETNVGSVTIPNPVNGAVYRVTGYINGSHTTAGSVITVRTKQGSGISVGGTVVSESVLTCAVASRRYPATLIGHFTYTGTTDAASFNVVLTAEASVAGGTVHGSTSGSAVTLYVDRVA